MRCSPYRSIMGWARRAVWRPVFVQSTGNPLNAAVASGVLALGDYHGGAIEAAMRLLLELEEREIAPDELVEEALKAKRLLPGFGHKLYKKQDPRAKQLVLLCTKLGYDAHHLANAIEIEYAIEEQKGKRLVLNIDGAIAALLLEMGFSPEMGKGFFIIARTPGLVAHAVEERQREKPVRRIPEEQITYDGK
jgi:citryl-CoA lyase